MNLVAYKPTGSNGWWIVGTLEHLNRDDVSGIATLFDPDNAEQHAMIWG